MKWILILGLLIPSSCATAPSEEGVVEEVREAVARVERADRELDAAAILAMIDPEFYSYQDGRRGTYAEVVEQIASFMPTVASFDANFVDVEVTPLGRDAALVTFVFRDVLTLKDGTVIEKWGPNTMVWRRRADGWKMVYVDADHYDVDGGAPNQVR